MSSDSYIKVKYVEETIKGQMVEENIISKTYEENIISKTYEENIISKTYEETIISKTYEEIIQVRVDGWPPADCDSGGSSPVFVIGVTGPGIISGRLFETDTVPPNTVIKEATTDTDEITIHFLAEGGDNYSPVVTVNNIVCDNLAQYHDDRRLFYGSVTLSLSSSATIPIISDTGFTTSVDIIRAGQGPSILSVNFIGEYPGVQTEVKENDNFQIEVTFDPSGTAPVDIEIYDFGACKAQSFSATNAGIDWGVSHTAILTGTVNWTGNIPQDLTCKIRAKNEIGTYGNDKESGNNITCNDTSPSFTDSGTTFPPGQAAFKEVEAGIQQTIVRDFSTLLYTSPTGEFAIQNSSVYESGKSIQATNPGTYNDSAVNFAITAYREENNTYNTFQKNIEIADTPPHITISQPYNRLRSSILGVEYTVTASSNQNILQAPSLLIPVGGTWSGNGFTGGPKIWNRNIQIKDTDTKGIGSWSFLVPPVNRAGLPATISGSQNNGGFTPRDLVLDAFLNEISVPVEVIDYTKLKVGIWEFTGNTLTRDTIKNDVPPVPGYFTIDDVNQTPHVFRVLDTNQTNASSQATIIYNYEELV